MPEPESEVLVPVRVTELSGNEFQVKLRCDDTILALRKKVSDQLRVPLWKLQLVHGAHILRGAAPLKDLGSDVEVMAIVANNEEVLQRSRELLEFFRDRHRTWGQAENERYRDAICNGEVDFNFEGWNFLERAIRKGHVNCVDLLLSSGASVNNVSINGSTPLMACAYCPCYRIMGCRCNIRCDETRLQIAHTLLKHGADPNVTSLDGSTPLLKVCEEGFYCDSWYEIADTLLKHGADPNVKSLDGSTPLLKVCEEGFYCDSWYEIADTLLKHGADPNVKSLDGSTPLLQVCEEGCYKLADILLKHGADPNVTSLDGSTPLLQVCEEGCYKLADILLKHGADPNVKSLDGSTPLLKACERGSYEIAETLLKHGANAKSLDYLTPLLKEFDDGFYYYRIERLKHEAHPDTHVWLEHRCLLAHGEDYFLSHWEAYKERNRKARAGNRRPQRNVVASSKPKRSSRVAIPAAWPGRDGINVLRALQRKGGFKQDLDLDLRSPKVSSRSLLFDVINMDPSACPS
eukprot:Skav230003  [mRNA]  locus=scaffold17:202092:203842:- [translate_table: standard]